MKISRTQKTITVSSLYAPGLPAPAKRLGGKWDKFKQTWTYDIRDEERVKNLYIDVYGEWPEDNAEPAELVTARVTLEREIWVECGGIFFGSRQVAFANGRDSGAKLGSGVVLLEGNFTSGGTWKKWTTIGKKGTIFEVRDIPIRKVQEATMLDRWGVEIIGDNDNAALVAEKKKTLISYQ